MTNMRSRKPKRPRYAVSAIQSKLRFGKRPSPHIFIALLFLIPTFHLFQQLPRHDLYSPLRRAPTDALSSDSFSSLVQVKDVAPLETRSVTVSTETIVDAVIEVVLICHYSDPCCITTFPTALRSLVRQTIIPTSLVLLHSCSIPQEQAVFQNVAKKVLLGNHSNSASSQLYETLTNYFCHPDSQRRYDLCVLQYLSKRTPTNPYRLLLSDHDVLEPTAVEKMWLYLQFRPAIPSVTTLPFEEESLWNATEKHDPMLVKPALPAWNHTTAKELSAVPMMYRHEALVALSDGDGNAKEGNPWEPLVKMLSKGRLLREALYTSIRTEGRVHDITYRQPLLSLQHATMQRRHIPPHLYSDLAFYKWSGREEEADIYNETFGTVNHLDIDAIATGGVMKAAVKRVMFLTPFIDMGGSEKAMLDLADRMLSMKWSVTFVLTMPNWAEDSLGEMTCSNKWLNKGLSLTSDVINLVALAPNHLRSKALRYMLESRRPDIVFFSNTRWGYGHSALIRTILPDALIADYNHMIHESWSGGGLPRFGANNSKYFDAHFTASEDVASSMEKWIDPRLMEQNPHKVRPCYIGTDPTLFYSGFDRLAARTTHRLRLGIPDNVTVILFAGRFVVGKGTDVITDLVPKSSSHESLVGKLFFLFVGDGTERRSLEDLKEKNKNVLILPPVQGLLEMRNYYAMSDLLLLPSVNEGIALVLYEAMAAEMLVITTNVGGQSELVTPDTGILIPNSHLVSQVTTSVIDSLLSVLANPGKYEKIRIAGRDKVRSRFTTPKFCDCVIDGLQSAERERGMKRVEVEETMTTLSRKLVNEALVERGDGLWKRGLAPRSLRHALTIGIKTYVCDEQTVVQVQSLVRSIRVNYPLIRVLLGNDGPTRLGDEAFVKNDDFTEEIVLKRDSGISVGRNTLVNMTTTKYFLLLDDDHVVDDSTNLVRVLTALEKGGFDIVGMRIRNLPGIEELERTGITIPRYVAIIESFKKRQLILCLWNENKGPSVYTMEEAIKVDVLHNAFMGRTDILRLHGWRDELQVNEHMTFFLDAWRAGVNVGYLPSEFVHHRARLYSKCYYKTRFREGSFAELLDYEDRFFYDIGCGNQFPNVVRKHLGTELDVDDRDEDRP